MNHMRNTKIKLGQSVIERDMTGLFGSAYLYFANEKNKKIKMKFRLVFRL